MKKYRFTAIAIILLAMVAFKTFGQQFEGSIRYETSVNGQPPAMVRQHVSKSYQLFLRGNDLKIKAEPPQLADILVKKDDKKLYLLRADLKNAYVTDFKESHAQKDNKATVVTKTKEQIQLSGYTCQKYILQYDDGMIIKVWTTQNINADQWNNVHLLGRSLKLPSDVPGFPLMFEMEMPSFTLTFKATAVNALKLNDSEFQVPSEYAIKQF